MKLPILIRILHYYASMACCFLFAFYACSGFIATHAEWFIGDQNPQWIVQTKQVPKEAIEDEGKLSQFCSGLLENAASTTFLDNDEYQQWVMVKSKDQALLCIVDDENALVELQRLFPIAKGDKDQELLAQEIAKQQGGRPANLEYDDEYNRLTFDLESVWSDTEVMVFNAESYYRVRQRPSHVIRAISDLHRGKHANGFQIFLADLTAILLMFVIVTGAVIGIQMKKRKKWGIIGLVFSGFLTGVLLVFR